MDGLDGSLAEAFLDYLADRGLFAIASDEQWRWNSAGETTVSRDHLDKDMEKLGAANTMNALSYFIKDYKASVLPQSPADSSSARSHLFGSKKTRSKNSSSDLSNQQIVKKMESQLRPFLEQEKILTALFEGPRVAKDRARLLCNFVMKQIQHQVPRREWEQLSRRRHR